jgi:arginine exporter protein ArgO
MIERHYLNMVAPIVGYLFVIWLAWGDLARLWNWPKKKEAPPKETL